ncbi:MAG: nucleoside triphosphate hydrolase [Phyllobacteriaceae bacterium]|nr:nucleoside triphosphate hydrolase [Phyllobacteriaceae bacterium]
MLRSSAKTVTSVDFASLEGKVLALPRNRRAIVAIAGAPGSGKSTLAEALVDRLNAAEPGRAALLPMDGYHFDDTLLDALGRRARKGAPDTFDVDGLRAMLVRLRANEDESVIVPVFDRAIEIARSGARPIARSVSIIVVEGNYLLLADEPWRRLRPLFDLTVLLDVPEVELRRRLTARWVGYGLSPDAIAAKLDGNDLPNGEIVRTRGIEPDMRLAN